MSTSAIPKGWREDPLGDVATIRRGISYKAEMLAPEREGLPYVNMKSFLKGGGFNSLGTKNYSGSYTNEDLIAHNDLLIANTDVTAGDIVGVPALLPDELSAVSTLCSHHVTRIGLSKALWAPFIFYLLCLPEYRSRMLAIARGTTVLMLDMQAIKKIPIRAPIEITEQRRIVEILDALDEAIRKTELVIAKLQQMKQGLRHDLLTRGIGENGELRNPERNPDQFKDSPLGRIPRGWNALKLGDLTTLAYRYPGYYGIEYVSAGILEIRGESIMADGNLLPELDSYRRVSLSTATRFPKVRLGKDDFVMTVRGTIGKFAQVPEWAKGSVITANLIRLSFSKEIAYPDWVRHFLHSNQFQFRLDLACSATTIKTIQAPALLSIPVTLPPVNEQRQIVRILNDQDLRISQESAELDKFRSLKIGLMDDLLTGSVRVHVDSEATAA
jgi:type I restriction enzyme S subunit